MAREKNEKHAEWGAQQMNGRWEKLRAFNLSKMVSNVFLLSYDKNWLKTVNFILKAISKMDLSKWLFLLIFSIFFIYWPSAFPNLIRIWVILSSLEMVLQVKNMCAFKSIMPINNTVWNLIINKTRV